MKSRKPEIDEPKRWLLTLASGGFLHDEKPVERLEATRVIVATSEFRARMAAPEVLRDEFGCAASVVAIRELAPDEASPEPTTEIVWKKVVDPTRWLDALEK